MNDETWFWHRCLAHCHNRDRENWIRKRSPHHSLLWESMEKLKKG